MEWKEILKPNKNKIILSIILFSVSLYLGNIFYNDVLDLALCRYPIGCVSFFGFPVPAGLIDGPRFNHLSDVKGIFNWWNIFAIPANIVFWYFFSILIIILFKRIKK